ncbi:MAG: tRNA preQ1(34) S-adenosylmethionine ribosyltransferase-isomerase QueA [Phycisphaerales bacterium]
MRTDDLDYHLPEELIAQKPADRRDHARLMVVRQGESVEHRLVRDLPALLRAGDLLVFNNTRVLPARFHARRVRTGGRIEGLFIETPPQEVRDDAAWTVLLRSGGRLRPGELLALLDLEDRVTVHELELIEQHDDGSWLVRKHSPLDTHTLLEQVGTMPLPPYIQRMRQLTEFSKDMRDMDRQRYQTVYAAEPGAVAAPTAGLHFTPALIDQLHQRGIQTACITLHVGLGTFQPIRAETLEQHIMHRERFSVPPEVVAALKSARAEGRRIIPVGTTSVRALESLPPRKFESGEGYTGETDLLIQPGYEFRFADGLMTNFHLPRSTLLALVGAMLSLPGAGAGAGLGLEKLLELYQQAINLRYRFYSYGDAMLILK